MEADIAIAPGFMVVKADVMEQYLTRAEMTPGEYAADLDTFMYEAYMLLSGEKIGIHLSRRFIRRHTARFAHFYIDWRAMSMSDPFPGIKKEIIKAKSLAKQDRRAKRRLKQ